MEYKHYAFLGRESTRAAVASECAAEQGLFWAYHDTLFLNQRGENLGTFADAALKSFAVALAMDTAAFDECLDSGRYDAVVAADAEEGRSRGVFTTPTMYINGQEVRGNVPYTQLQQMIEQALISG
jgi:protein-disulfide isomerase